MGSKKRILIVDDEESLAYFLSENLAQAAPNLVVETAHTAQKAALKIKAHPPDLLITDLRMPGVDGLQLSTWVRATFPDTRMILMTAYGNDEVEAEARRLEVYRYITKPFQVQDLVTAAREALGELALGDRGVLALSDKSFGAITVALEALRVDIGARCILLADSMGQLVTRSGVVHDLDVTMLLALLSNTFLATLELARCLDEPRPAGFNYLECRLMDVYAVMVNEGLFLALLFDKVSESSRVGTVWFYTRKAVNKLAQMMRNSDRMPPAAEPGLAADFGDSLTAELDEMLAELEAELEPEKENNHIPPPWLADNLPFPTESALLDIEAALERGLIDLNAAELLRGGRAI